MGTYDLWRNAHEPLVRNLLEVRILASNKKGSHREDRTVSIERCPSCKTLPCSRTVHSKALTLASCCTSQGDVFPVVALLKAHSTVQPVLCSVQPIQELELELLVLIQPQIPDSTAANAAKCFDRSGTLCGLEHVELLVRIASVWHKHGKHGASFVAMSRFFNLLWRRSARSKELVKGNAAM